MGDALKLAGRASFSASWGCGAWVGWSGGPRKATSGACPPSGAHSLRRTFFGAMAHALRHSYGLELAVRGVLLPVIQQLLGHTDPRTTSISTAPTPPTSPLTLHGAGLL